jgi:hypothetical protein
MLTKKSAKIRKEFVCINCNYATSDKKDYNKHIVTSKHKNNTNVDILLTASEKKSELLAEIIGQITTMFLGILIIHRIITFIPTYSGEKYVDFSVTNIILAMLVIILSLQTKLGEKVSIIVDRIMELWEGPKDQKKGKKGQNNIKVSQPISQNSTAAMTQSLGSTSISSLPQQQSTQQLPDYNNMYQQDPTPLVGAATPGMEEFGPMAANSAIGGSFGSAFGW